MAGAGPDDAFSGTATQQQPRCVCCVRQGPTRAGLDRRAKSCSISLPMRSQAAGLKALLQVWESQRPFLQNGTCVLCPPLRARRTATVSPVVVLRALPPVPPTKRAMTSTRS